MDRKRIPVDTGNLDAGPRATYQRAMLPTLQQVGPTQVEARLRDELEGVAHLEVEDLTGTQDHYQVTVVASSFEGLTRIEMHQAVYKALGDWMRGPIHALALNTFTPDSWNAKNSKA